MIDTDTLLRLAADLVLAVHFLYVAFVVFGLAAIVWGALRRRPWVRNPVFRLLHLAAIAIVALQAMLGLACPLTVWEYELRAAAGQSPAELDFIPRLFQQIVFYEFPPEFFLALYISLTAVVVLTLWLVPPRRGTRSARDTRPNRRPNNRSGD